MMNPIGNSQNLAAGSAAAYAQQQLAMAQGMAPQHAPLQQGGMVQPLAGGRQVLDPNAYVPGMGGLMGGQGVMPGGAASFSRFMPSRQRKARGPMEGREMLDLRKRTQAWFDSYLLQSRGQGLQPHEELPPLLLLIMAKHHTREPQRNICLRAMEHLTVPLSTSNPVTVYWGRQEFTAVPYAVQSFPLHIAISILDTCERTIYDDVNTYWDAHDRRIKMRYLQPQEKTVVSFHRWRAPNAQEERLLNQDYGINPGTMIQVADESMGSSLLLSFAPDESRVELSKQMGVPYGQDASSAPVQADPNPPRQVQQPAPPAQQTQAEVAPPAQVTGEPAVAAQPPATHPQELKQPAPPAL